MLQTAGMPDSSSSVMAGTDLARFPRVTELATLFTKCAGLPVRGFDVGLTLVLDGIERFTELSPERQSMPDDRGMPTR